MSRDEIIEQATKVMHAEVCCPCDPQGCDWTHTREVRYAHALADAGLLATARTRPTREQIARSIFLADREPSEPTPGFSARMWDGGHAGDVEEAYYRRADVVLALSYSGESDEILTLLPVLKRQGNPLIAMTGRERSTLAREAEVHLDVSVPAEACPLDLAPTSSTTASPGAWSPGSRATTSGDRPCPSHPSRGDRACPCPSRRAG